MALSRNLLTIAILCIAVTFSIVLLVAVWRGKLQQDRQMAAVSEVSEAEMTLTDMEYTEMQQGKRIWMLKAAEAKYYQEKQKTTLEKVRLVFFLNDGEEIHLKSARGVLYAGSKDIELLNSVHAVFPRGYELDTDEAYYSHQKQLISSEAAILVTGPDIVLQGRHWKYVLPERRAFLEGDVKATLTLVPEKTE